MGLGLRWGNVRYTECIIYNRGHLICGFPWGSSPETTALPLYANEPFNVCVQSCLVSSLFRFVDAGSWSALHVDEYHWVIPAVTFQVPMSRNNTLCNGWEKVTGSAMIWRHVPPL
jgi:hypothetical protein